jgi:hypothetical protein
MLARETTYSGPGEKEPEQMYRSLVRTRKLRGKGL